MKTSFTVEPELYKRIDAPDDIESVFLLAILKADKGVQLIFTEMDTKSEAMLKWLFVDHFGKQEQKKFHVKVISNRLSFGKSCYGDTVEECLEEIARRFGVYEYWQAEMLGARTAMVENEQKVRRL